MQLLNYLKIDGVKIFGESDNKTGIISFNIFNIHHYDIGVLLDKMGIAYTNRTPLYTASYEKI